jgi:leucyl-tRNA synthetase
MDGFRFNTLVAGLMEFNNHLVKVKESAYGTPAWEEAIDTLLLLMAPSMPHIAEELWQRRHGVADAAFDPARSVHVQPWPQFDPALAKTETVTLVVQINGKVRDRIEAPAGIGEAEARELVSASPNVQKWLEGKQVVKVIFAGGKLLNIVVR